MPTMPRQDLVNPSLVQSFLPTACTDFAIKLADEPTSFDCVLMMNRLETVTATRRNYIAFRRLDVTRPRGSICLITRERVGRGNAFIGHGFYARLCPAIPWKLRAVSRDDRLPNPRRTREICSTNRAVIHDKFCESFGGPPCWRNYRWLGMKVLERAKIGDRSLVELIGIIIIISIIYIFIFNICYEASCL